jgi:hypothetical protein
VGQFAGGALGFAAFGSFGHDDFSLDDDFLMLSELLISDYDADF